MAVDTYALTTVESFKSCAGIADGDIQVPGLTIWHDKSSSATAATVAVSSTTLTLVITGGGNAGTDTLTLADAANDTLSEIAGVINALAKGWVAVAVGTDAATSSDLVATEATSAYGLDNVQTLDVVDNYAIERLINAVSDRIEVYCGRRIKSREMRLLLHGSGTGQLELGIWPVTQVKRVAVGRRDAIEVQHTDTTKGSAVIQIAPTAEVDASVPDLSALTVNLIVNETTTAITVASFVTLTALATQIETNSNWTATVKHAAQAAGAHVSKDLIPVGGLNALTPNAAMLEIPDEDLIDYDIDRTRGVLHHAGGFTAGRNNVLVLFTAGFVTVPDDIRAAADQFAKDVHDAANRDGGLKSERTATYSYVAKAAGVGLSEDVKEMLMPYRRWAA